jgi:hypothetical protein
MKIYTKLDYALGYAMRFGWHIFPVHEPIFDNEGRCVGCTCEKYRRTERCRSSHPYMYLGTNGKCTTPGKCPRVGWRSNSTNKQKTILGWWKQWPNANIGIDCGKSGLLVLDYDLYKEYFDGSDMLTEEEQETTTSISGGGGQHLFYLQPEDRKFGNSKTGLPPGIDVRGMGGYVVAPPSIHSSGRFYQWEEAFRPSVVLPKPLPLKLYKMLSTAETAQHCSVEFRDRNLPMPNVKKWDLKQEVVSLIYHGHLSKDRSRTDQIVITSLAAAGADDDEILAVFSHYPIGLMGKFAEKGERYLATSIAKARKYLADVAAMQSKHQGKAKVVERFGLRI